MPNILLTQKCVRSCPYCFAKKHMKDSISSDMLSWDDLIYIADLIEYSGDKNIYLLGGEPTLHPDFVDFVLYLIQRNFHVMTFTSGIMSENKLQEVKKHLSKIDPKALSFICNLNHPNISTQEETKKINAFLKEFGNKISLSFNIYNLDFEMDYLFQYIERYKLNPYIRLGLAHVIPGEKNKYIPPKNFDKMINKLSSYIPDFERMNINVFFDCGFPLCKFTDEQLGKFFRIAGKSIESLIFACNPAIDIGPDMKVWSCFPLANFDKKSFYEFDSIQDIQNYFNKFHKKIRKEAGGIYKECLDCQYRKNKQCSGGCLAHILNQSIENKKELKIE